MEPLSLSLTRPARPVTLEDADGNAISYELREMSAAARDAYLDALSKRMTIGPDGKRTGELKDMEGAQALLVSRCLFKEGKAVDVKTIQTWPASAVSALFLAAQELNTKLNNGELEKNE